MSEDAGEFLRQFGSNVRRWRLRANLTQAQLAVQLHTATRHVQRIEWGAANMTLKYLRRIAAVLRTTPATLLRPNTIIARKPGRPRKRQRP